MASVTRRMATIDDLSLVEGKAELIAVEFGPVMPTGSEPNLVSGEIFLGLKLHARATGEGLVYTDDMGFTNRKLSSGRESFSPDVAYHAGPRQARKMKFVAESPTLAVEVRSESEHGKGAESAMAAKRADYFEAGTKVVWDVDPEACWVRSYRVETPNEPTLFVKGQVANAEPAVPGWRIALDDLFVS